MAEIVIANLITIAISIVIVDGVKKSHLMNINRFMLYELWPSQGSTTLMCHESCCMTHAAPPFCHFSELRRSLPQHDPTYYVSSKGIWNGKVPSMKWDNKFSLGTAPRLEHVARYPDYIFNMPYIWYSLSKYDPYHMDHIVYC